MWRSTAAACVSHPPPGQPAAIDLISALLSRTCGGSGPTSSRPLSTICQISKAAQLKLDNGPQPLVVPPDCALVIIGIDPDSSGAIAVVQWDVAAARSPDGMPLNFEDATIGLWDMPMMLAKIGTRNRRQPDSAEIARLLHELLPSLQDKAAVNVVLEQPVPNALNGKFSWYNSGLSYGVWLGILAAYAMPFQTPKVRRWKQDMQLNGMGKEGSRQLALQLFPQMAGSLKRKKDHGRAEALLIAAWASQIPIPTQTFQMAFASLTMSAEAAAQAEDTETSDELQTASSAAH